MGWPNLFKYCPDQIIRRCVPESEFQSILNFCHSYAYGWHFGAKKTPHKILQCGFYWPYLFKDAHKFCKTCIHYQSTDNITQRDMDLISTRCGVCAYKRNICNIGCILAPYFKYLGSIRDYDAIHRCFGQRNFLHLIKGYLR